MRVFLTGASGLIGAGLASDLLRDGHEVVAVSRVQRSGAAGGERGGIEWIVGDVCQTGSWCDALERCDAVVHLAGEPVVAGRWTAARKRRIVASRVESARQIAAVVRRANAGLRVLVCASASGFYGSRGEEQLSEDSAAGDDFLARLCADWEAAANEAAENARVVSLRFGVVLSAKGGALARMLLPFRLGLGGPLGPAGRWFPWVHEDDAIGLTRFALEHAIQGPVNVVAPGSVTMGEFAKTLGRVLARPAVLPVPGFLLSLALGEQAGAIMAGQKIAPQAAEAAGYAFRHAELESALRALL